MYIRIDLSVFFVTQNVGETSKVEFSLESLSENTLPKEETSIICKRGKTKEDVENLQKGVSRYFMTLLLPVVLQK